MIFYMMHSFRHTLSYIIYSNLKNFLDRKYGLMNYAIEYCPVCKKREVVYTTGQTKCSNCSTLITPCDETKKKMMLRVYGIQNPYGNPIESYEMSK